jgi:outer membrane protein OmpA-like peptidoglycan-associated protein
LDETVYFTIMKMRTCFIVAGLLFSMQQAEGQTTKDTLISLYFRTGSYDLDSTQVAQLKAVVTSTTTIKQIIGFADSRGTRSSNLLLSKKRAEAVHYVLADYKGALPLELSYKGEAYAQSTERQQDRRVDVVAIVSTITPATETAVRSLDLDNIYFVPDSAVIVPQSLPQIRDLAKTLQNYQGEYFEIIGHANCQETLEPSKIKHFYRLSEQRAKLIYLLLIEQGIPAEKLSYKGVGNLQPAIGAPQSVAEKKMNMRVQILITNSKTTNSN